MNRLTSLCLGAASFAIIHQPLSSSAGLQLWSWNFTGKSGEDISFESTFTELGLETSTLTRNPDAQHFFPYALVDGFAAEWYNGETEPVLSKGYYFSFTLTPQSGKAYSISSVSFTVKAADPNYYPFDWQIRSSVDSYANTLGTAATITDGGEPVYHSINLGGDSSFQNVSSSIQFRLYGYNNTGFAGLISVDPGAYGLSVGGTVSAVPETGSTALIAGIGLGLFALRHRFNTKQ